MENYELLIFRLLIFQASKLTSDSNSSPPITLWSSFIRNILGRCFFDPADIQASNQADNLCLQDSSLREREQKFSIQMMRKTLRDDSETRIRDRKKLILMITLVDVLIKRVRLASMSTQITRTSTVRISLV